MISQIKGYFSINTYLSLSLAITIFSFAGIPPLVGFFAKQMVISAALDSGYIFLTLISILTSVIGAVYYLGIIKQVFFDRSEYKRFLVLKKKRNGNILNILYVNISYVYIYILYLLYRNVIESYNCRLFFSSPNIKPRIEERILYHIINTLIYIYLSLRFIFIFLGSILVSLAITFILPAILMLKLIIYYSIEESHNVNIKYNNVTLSSSLSITISI